MRTLTTSLESLFYPRSIAVIGASSKPQTIGAEIFRNLLKNEFAGPVYPINQNAAFVQSVQAYSSILDIPGQVDLAVIVVPAKSVLEIAKSCVQKQVKALIVISAGFGETGPEGLKRQDELTQLCREHHIRLVGPNCLGVLSAHPDIRLNATFAPTFPPAGNVAFSSQSGALGLSILDYAAELGIGISNFISVGNKADVSGNDLIAYWEKDPRTDVILLYLESFGNPKKFLSLASRVSKQKPIVAVKSGRSEAGAKAAASHTGSLAGADALVQELFRQTGVIRADTVEELFDTAMLLANQPLPQGNSVVVITNAGGPGILAADACEQWGLKLPTLKDETQILLKEFLPQEASVRNPVDMIASATPQAYEKAISILLNDTDIHSLVVLYVPPMVTTPSEVATAIVKASLHASKPLLTCFMGTHGIPSALGSFRENQIPSYRFPEAAVKALARVERYARWKNKPAGTTIHFSDIADVNLAKKNPTPGAWMPTVDLFQLLKDVNIPTVPTHLATTPENCAQVASELGFPVVLKLEAMDLVHKTEVGGVMLNIENKNEVIAAAQLMLKRYTEAGHDVQKVKGWLVQPMADKGLEVIIGAYQDPKFGPLFMFGLGGVDVEVLKDTSFCLYPFTDRDVSNMLKRIRGYPLLTGHRGKPMLDIEAVENIILRMGEVFHHLPSIAEFDFNPVRVMEKGKGALVLDARLRFN